MRYYAYNTDCNNFATFKVSQDQHERLEADVWHGSVPLAASWTPLPLYHDVPEPSKMEDGDFAHLLLTSIPLFSQRAWEILDPLLGCQWEALPIIHPRGKPFYIVHVMETIDCIDLERSEIKRYTDGRIMCVERFWLKEDLLVGKHVFKIPPGKGRPLLLVDDVFRETVEQHGLKGLIFRRIPLVSDGPGGPTMSQLELFAHMYNEEGEPIPEMWKLDEDEEPPEVKHKADRPLDREFVEEVQGQIELSMYNLRLDPATATADEIQERVYEAVNIILDERASLEQATVDDAVLQLGCLWAQSVCDELGWEWAHVAFDDEESIGIVSPSRSHVVFPLFYFRDLLSDPEGDPNCLLLYNMLKGGAYSDSACEYVVLG